MARTLEVTKLFIARGSLEVIHLTWKGLLLTNLVILSHLRLDYSLTVS